MKRPNFPQFRKELTVFPFSLAAASLHLRNALTVVFSWTILFALLAAAQESAEQSSRIVERGEDFAVYQRVTAMSGADGSVTYQTNRFTLLENCLNYFEDRSGRRARN